MSTTLGPTDVSVESEEKGEGDESQSEELLIQELFTDDYDIYSSCKVKKTNRSDPNLTAAPSAQEQNAEESLDTGNERAAARYPPFSLGSSLFDLKCF